MYAHYRLHINELDEGFVDTLRKLFANREVEIAITDAASLEDDETAYLLRSSANRRRLLKAVENIERKRDLVSVDLEEVA